MIEAMICQAFSRIYCLLSLVKLRCTDAYQVRRNRIEGRGLQRDVIKSNFALFVFIVS